MFGEDFAPVFVVGELIETGTLTTEGEALELVDSAGAGTEVVVEVVAGVAFAPA